VVIDVSSVELKVPLATDRALVMRDDLGTVYAVDPGTATVLASQPYPQIKGLAFGFGSLWLAGFETGVVRRIDPTTLIESAVVDVGVDPTRVAVTGDAVWSSDHRGGTVTHIDPGANTAVRTIEISGTGPGGPQETLVDGNDLWIAVPFFNQVTRLDTVSGEIIANVDVECRATAWRSSNTASSSDPATATASTSSTPVRTPTKPHFGSVPGCSKAD